MLDGCDGSETPRLRGRALVSTANLGSLIGRSGHDWHAMLERAIELLEGSKDDIGLGAARNRDDRSANVCACSSTPSRLPSTRTCRWYAPPR